MPANRRSFWNRTFAAARASGDWYRVDRFYTRATAVQITSDISCSHTRDPHRHRMRGILPGERWEARWEPAVDGAPSDLVVWIRLVPTVQLAPDHGEGLDEDCGPAALRLIVG